MQKLFYLFFIFSFTLVYSQKYTVAQVEKTNDPKVIAVFLKDNPDHPRAGEFKIKLVTLIRPNNDEEAKPRVKPLSKDKLARDYKRDVRDGTNDKNKQAAKILTQLFNNDPNKKEVIIQIVNKSKCNLVVKINGNDYYNLNVPAKNQNFIMVKKGSYVITTSVCDAKYTSAKKVHKDLSISLNTN